MSRPRSIPSKVMDFTGKMKDVIDTTDCKRHKVPEGVPCFHLRMDSQEGYYAAICNTRATKIYDGVPSSIDKSRKAPARVSQKERR